MRKLKCFEDIEKMQISVIIVCAVVSALCTTSMGTFVTKVDGGFDRIVVSIEDTIALPPNTDGVGAIGSTGGSSGSISRKATQDCKTVIEKIKELINHTSDYLFKVTYGKTYFRQVTILLPSNWATTNCTGRKYNYGTEEEVLTATHETHNSADFIVTGDHPVYIDRPWTLQYGPCGTPGLHTSIPISFLVSSRGSEDVKARLMVREWLKLRYGVFDENGFGHDERYPKEYIGPNGKPVPTTCQLNRSSFLDGKSCNETSVTTDSVESETSAKGLVDKYDEPSTSSTSMMSLPLDPHVNELCNEHTHDRATPTKHNFLCDGQSIWEVMKQHEDFSQLDGAGNGNLNQHDEDELPIDATTSKNLNGYFKSVGSAPPPTFNFVTAKSHRMIFLLDRSRAMNQNGRWANLRRSLYRMFHYVPSGTELGVISYTNSTSVSLPLKVATTHNRDQLHGHVPLRSHDTDSRKTCILCAVRKAVKMLRTQEEDVGPATIILVNGSPGIIESTKEWTEVKKLIKKTPLRLILITYADMDGSREGERMMELAEYGQFFRIPDTTLLNHNLEQSRVLNDIFLQVTHHAFSTPLSKVYQNVHWPDQEWESKGQFPMEESLGRNTWVTITTEEIGDVDGLQLVSPTGKLFDLPLHAEGLVYLRIPGVTEAGIWSYTINFYRNQSPRPVSVDVITEARKSESISVNFWNQVVDQEIQDNGHASVTSSVEVTSSSSSLGSGGVPEPGNSIQPPIDTLKKKSQLVILYAKVLQGELPVLNANVTATVTLPGSSQHSPNQIQVQLYDSGTGDPDITWGDGIYSAYFTQLGPNPGYFSVSVYINDNHGQAVVPVHTNLSRDTYDQPACCGSSVPHIATIPTGSFSRITAGPSFEVTRAVPLGLDPYPPGRVTDLRVESIEDSLSKVKLSWTAPGDDYNQGKAARYEIRCYLSRDSLTNDKFGTRGILVHSALTPEPANHGMRQSCTVSIPWSNEYFYYGIVAIDNAMNRGKVSNLISVYIKEIPSSTTKLADAWDDDALVSNLTSSRSLKRKEHVTYEGGATWFRGFNETELYVIIGGGAATLILVSIFILILVCLKRRKNKSSEAPPAYQNIYSGSGSNENGKATSTEVAKKDSVSCCTWDADSSVTDHGGKSHKLGGMNGPYIAEKTSSYIPASALCAPQHQGNGIYREMYGGPGVAQPHQIHDSSSVDSKPSDGGGSNETVQVSDGLHTPGSFYAPSHHSISLSMGMPNGFEDNHAHNRYISHNSLANRTSHPEFHTSDDDEGGFKSPNRNGDMFHHKIVPMPNPSSDYDSPSIMNGSTYGGSVISISNSKKRTRHISFV